MKTKPVIIFSYWNNNNYYSEAKKAKYKHHQHEQNLYKTAKIANFLIQSLGYHTVLYTDSVGQKIFRNIPYSEVIKFDEQILNKLPCKIWSLGKLLAMSMEKRPFFHIDFDLFFFSDYLLNRVMNMPDDKTFILHKEPWLIKTYLRQKHSIDFIQTYGPSFNIPEEDFNKLSSFNMAFFGSRNKNNISYINNMAKFILDTCIKLENIVFNGSTHEGALAIRIEQFFFTYLINKKYELVPLIPNVKSLSHARFLMEPKGAIHFCTMKNSKEFTKMINEISRNLENLYSF